MPKTTKPGEAKNISYTFKISKDLRDKLRANSKEKGVSEGEHIRSLIKTYNRKA